MDDIENELSGFINQLKVLGWEILTEPISDCILVLV